MPDIENTTRKVIGLMAKYNADHDYTPGLPMVTNTDFTVLNILVDLLTMIDDLQKKTAILRAAQVLKSETENAPDPVQ